MRSPTRIILYSSSVRKSISLARANVNAEARIFPASSGKLMGMTSTGILCKPQKKSLCVRSGKRGGQVRAVSAGPFPWNFRSAVPHCNVQTNRHSAPSCSNKMSLRPTSSKIGTKLPPICLHTLHQSQHVRQVRTLRRLIVGIEYKRH